TPAHSSPPMNEYDVFPYTFQFKRSSASRAACDARVIPGIVTLDSRLQPSSVPGTFAGTLSRVDHGVTVTSVYLTVDTVGTLRIGARAMAMEPSMMLLSLNTNDEPFALRGDA